MPTRIFISWSGPRSKVVADALRKVLPDAMQQVEVWMSASDIQAGERWGAQLNQQLSQSQFGILCLTKENLHAPWLLFEAGSIAKSVDFSRVLPLLLDIEPTNVPSPLAQFQSVPIDKVGFRRVLVSLNAQTDAPLTEDRITRIAEQWWPLFEAELSTLRSASPAVRVREPSDRELLDDILLRLRSTTSPVQSAAWSHAAIEGFLRAARQFHESRRLELIAAREEIVARGQKPSGMYDDYTVESEDVVSRLAKALEVFASRARPL